MGDYNLFDDVNENEAKLTRQASAEIDKVNEAVFEAKRRYASFVANSKDDAEFKTRLAYLGNDVHTLVAEYTTPTPAVMRKVRAALKPIFAASASDLGKKWESQYPVESGQFDELSKDAETATKLANKTGKSEDHRAASSMHAGAADAADRLGFSDRAAHHRELSTYHYYAPMSGGKKSSSVKTAWNYDPRAKTYTATGLDSIAFSCPNCSSVHDELGFNRCKCGKVWNSYAIKSGDKTANGTTLICREVNERPTVLASKKVAMPTDYPSARAAAEMASSIGLNTYDPHTHATAANAHRNALKLATNPTDQAYHQGMANMHQKLHDSDGKGGGSDAYYTDDGGTNRLRDVEGKVAADNDKKESKVAEASVDKEAAAHTYPEALKVVERETAWANERGDKEAHMAAHDAHLDAADLAPTKKLKEHHEDMAMQHRMKAQDAPDHSWGIARDYNSSVKEDASKIAEASVPKESAYELLATLAEKATGMANKTNTEAYHRAAASEHGKAAKQAPTDGLRELHEAAAKVHREQADMRKKELKTTAEFSSKYNDLANKASKLSMEANSTGNPATHRDAANAHADAAVEAPNDHLWEHHTGSASHHMNESMKGLYGKPLAKKRNSSQSMDADFELGWKTAKAGIDLPNEEASLSRDWYEGYIAALQTVASPTSDPDGFIIPGEEKSEPEDPDEWKQEQEDYAKVEDMNNDKPRDEEAFEPVPFTDKKSSIADPNSYEDAAHHATLATRNAVRKNQTRPTTSHGRAYDAHIWAASVAPDQESHDHHLNMANWHENMAADADGAWGAKPGKMPRRSD